MPYNFSFFVFNYSMVYFLFFTISKFLICQRDGPFDNFLTISRFAPIKKAVLLFDKSDFLTGCCIKFSLSRKSFFSYKLLKLINTWVSNPLVLCYIFLFYCIVWVIWVLYHLIMLSYPFDIILSLEPSLWHYVFLLLWEIFGIYIIYLTYFH